MRTISRKCWALSFLICFFFQIEASATSAPSNLIATGASSGQVDLTWTDNSSSETGFTFAYDTNSGLTSPTYVYAGGVNTTSYSHTGRSAATTYYYKIKAEGNPDSAWSAVKGATTAPSGLVATATSSSQISLTWTGNGSNTSISGYTYAYANNSSFTGATYHYVAGGGTAGASQGSLGTATTYWFKIKAEGTSDALDSPYGTVVKTTTAPAGLAASVASSSQINLSWTGNAGNSNLSGYTVAYATNSLFSGAVYRYVAGAGSASFNSTGLFAGTTYYFKIKAEGVSDSADSAFTAPIAAMTSSAAPNAPSSLTATVVSSSQINLSWTDNSSDETGFEIKRATDSGFTQGVQWIGGIQGATHSDTGLSASTTYYYKVRAQGAAQDSAYSTAVSATTTSSGTTIPDAPNGLSATAVSGTQVNLSWTDNSTNETGFEIKRATDSAFTQNVVWIGGIQGTIYANTGLTPASTYYYKVRAEGTEGKSAYSGSVSTTTGSLPPDPILPHFAGINAWMPYRIGREVHNGKLSTNPDDPIWTKVQESGVQIMRYGGHAVDRDANPTWTETMDQYVMMVDAMRSKGIEPVLQVPVYGGDFTAEQAADIVRYVNFVNGTRAPRAVTYWVIGNEPDLPDPNDDGYGSTGFTAHQVAEYLKAFSLAMKAVDAEIKIIGPETAWYDTDIIEDLTTCGGADDVTGRELESGRYYVDIISFHIYPFNGTQTSRSSVIGKLMGAGGFNARLGELATRLDACNDFHGRTGGDALEMAVTEANINYKNNVSDDVYGLGSKSFLGGQFWAEMMGIAMQRGVDFITFWSVIEGGAPAHLDTENGYISGDGATLRPSYYHFQMMSQNFRGSSVAATDDQTNVKTFGAKDVDQIAVMIMNQETSTNFNYTVRLEDTGTVSGTNPLKIKINAGIAAEYSGSISAQSSILLVFDASGAIKTKIEYKLYGHANASPPSPPARIDY